MEQDTPPEQSPDGGLTTDFHRKMSYGDFLGLDALLAAQKPISGQHDEKLLITIHQVQELWLLLHEPDLATLCIREDRLRPAFKAMARVGRNFQTWRFRHMRRVERIISDARGTGASAGVAYLCKAIERRFFAELCEARTALA